MQTNMKKYFCYSFNEGENLTATHNLIRVEWRVELKDNGEEILYDHWDMGVLKLLDLRVKYWVPRYNNEVMGKKYKEFTILKDINSERDLINFMKVFKKKSMAALKEADLFKYKDIYGNFETKIFKLLENALTKEIREIWEPPLEIENQLTYLHKDGFENTARILTNNGFYLFHIHYIAFIPHNYNLVKCGEPDFKSSLAMQDWGIYKLPGDRKHPLIANDYNYTEVIKEDKYSFSEKALKTALKKMKLSNNQIEDFLKKVNEWFENGKKAFLIKINPLGCFEDYKIFPRPLYSCSPKPTTTFELEFEKETLRGLLFYDKPLTFKWNIWNAANHNDIYRTCDNECDSLEVLKTYLINNLGLAQDKAFEITEALWNSFEDHGEFVKEEPEVEREDSEKEIVWHYAFTTMDGKDGRIIVRLDEDFLKGIVSKFCDGGCNYIDGPNEMNFGLYIAVHGLRGSFESEILSKGKTDCRYYKRNVWSFEQTFRDFLPKEIWEEAYKTLKADLVDKFWAKMKPKKPE